MEDLNNSIQSISLSELEDEIKKTAEKIIELFKIAVDVHECYPEELKYIFENNNQKNNENHL